MIPAQRDRIQRTLLVALATIMVLMVPSSLWCQAVDAPPDSVRFADDDEVALFMKHLRGHWDDIHDVIMRFHLDDPFLKGQVVVDMIWKETRLQSATPLDNNTGNDDFSAALIAAVQPWEIDSLTGPCKLIIPFATRIVGSEDSTFSDCGILTGVVKNAKGEALAGAELFLFPEGANAAKLPPVRTNREGVYIMTLVPPGDWKLSCQLDGFEQSVAEVIDIKAGQHRRLDFALQTKQR